MRKYEVKNIDAGLLSSGFDRYGATIPTLKSLNDLFSNWKEYSKNPEEFIKSHPDFVFSGRITKVVTDRIIRPYVIISDKLEFMDKKKLSNIIKFNIDLFTAYFLQAVKILANVYNVDLSMIARQVTDKTMIKSVSKFLRDRANKAGVEDITDVIVSRIVDENIKVTFGLEDDNEEENDNPTDTGVTTTTEYSFKEAEKELKLNEGFIKIVNLDLKIQSKTGDNKKEIKVTLPFVIAPLVVYTDSESFIKNALNAGVEDSFADRWLKFKSGEIGLWDLIFAGDLIREYKRNKIKNKNDIVNLIRNKNLGNIIHSALTLEGGFTTYTNIYIFDKSDEMLIEDILQEDLIDPEVWQDLALKLLAFDINFVDVEKETITNFITDMPTYSVLTFNDIKKKTKDNDDINELLKALLVNKPVF